MKVYVSEPPQDTAHSFLACLLPILGPQSVLLAFDMPFKKQKEEALCLLTMYHSSYLPKHDDLFLETHLAYDDCPECAPALLFCYCRPPDLPVKSVGVISVQTVQSWKRCCVGCVILARLTRSIRMLSWPCHFEKLTKITGWEAGGGEKKKSVSGDAERVNAHSGRLNPLSTHRERPVVKMH